MEAEDISVQHGWEGTGKEEKAREDVAFVLLFQQASTALPSFLTLIAHIFAALVFH